ncbi:MAG: hypothetical protein QM770_18075 [Tepidisphaeraceae bacterium]
MRIDPRRQSTLMTWGLFLNAGVIGALALVLLSRPGAPTIVAPAMAQQAPIPIAGGAGFFLMPAQLGPSQWGCYVMDVDAQTLAVYYYDFGNSRLDFKAGRSFVYDRQLKNYNTSPDPLEMKKAVEAEKSLQQLTGNSPTTQP